MKKVYYAKKEIDVVFLSDKEGFALEKEANKFLIEESKNHKISPLLIKELKTVSDVPNDWRDALIWGSDEEEDLSVAEALSDPDPEYKEYLRLKEKYE